jgi:2-furoate---CoA ligase
MFDVGTTLLAAVERDARALAIVDGDVRLDYGTWLDQVLRVVDGFDRLGLKKGDHLVTVLQNRLEMATLHWACQLAGVIVTPLNWRAKPEEIDYVLDDAEAKAIVFEPASAEAVAGSASAAGLPRIALDEAEPATARFADLLAGVPADPVARAAPEDWSLMLYTSGTTGRGKGVPRRHRAERAAAVAHVAQNIYRFGERTLGVMPLYHTMGVRSLLAMAVLNGCFVCLPRFDPAKAVELIERERITNLYLVPTLYHDMIGHAEFARRDISSVRKLGFAGAPMPDGLLARVTAAFKPELFVNHYGSSEVYTFTINQRAAEKPSSAGKAGINQRIRVVRLDATSVDDRASPGEEGQVIASLQSDEAFEGYWNRPDADAKSIRDGWYYTGDLGYLDPDGDLFVTGRVDDMIITGGENVLPAEIENVLSLHPMIAEVVVAGLPDERWGSRIAAFIRRSGPLETAELDAWCRDSDLANFKRPREYIFVREIPKSPVGKILRRKLVAGEYERESEAYTSNQGVVA